MRQLSEDCRQQDSKQGESVASGPQSRPVAAGRGSESAECRGALWVGGELP